MQVNVHAEQILSAIGKYPFLELRIGQGSKFLVPSKTFPCSRCIHWEIEICCGLTRNIHDGSSSQCFCPCGGFEEEYWVGICHLPELMKFLEAEKPRSGNVTKGEARRYKSTSFQISEKKSIRIIS